MHHNYVVSSGRRTSTDYVWPVTLVAGPLYNLLWRASASSHLIQCNVPTSEAILKKRCTCFLRDAKSPTMYGCALLCSQIVYQGIRPYTLNTTTAYALYFVAECPDVTVLVCGRVQVTTHSYFIRP